MPAGQREASPWGTSVPPPRFHTIHYAGVLAAASPWRSRISAQPPLGGRHLRPRTRRVKSPKSGCARADIAPGRNSWSGPLPWTCPEGRLRASRLSQLPGEDEAARRCEETRRVARSLASGHRPLPGCGGRADRGREASPWGMPNRSPGRGPPYWRSRVRRRQALGDENQCGDPGSKGERAAWPWVTRQRSSGGENAGCTARWRSLRTAGFHAPTTLPMRYPNALTGG